MNCLNCGNEVHAKTIKEKKFCSSVCRNRHNMKLNYQKKKDDPEYREKNRLHAHKWYQRNKEQHNKRMREYMREYYRKKYSKKAREQNGN